jgi:hypothetical protein
MGSEDRREEVDRCHRLEGVVGPGVSAPMQKLGLCASNVQGLVGPDVGIMQDKTDPHAPVMQEVGEATGHVLEEGSAGGGPKELGSGPKVGIGPLLCQGTEEVEKQHSGG